jgi:CHAT domain-containing protein/tetratricopeptide (TPR) repeat protein
MILPRTLRRLLPAPILLLGCDLSPDPRHVADASAAPSLGPVTTTPDPVTAGHPDSLLALGERIYLRGEYDSARSVWSAALNRSRAHHDSVAHARALTWLGLNAWRQGDYTAARTLGEKALELKRRWDLEAELFKSYNALGLLAWNEGRLASATQLFGQASAAALAGGDVKGVAAASGNLALVQTELGEFEAARRGFDEMRVAGRALGDQRIEGNALTNLGMLAVRVGDAEAAILALGEARRLYRSIGYATGEQNALGQLGTAYQALGEPRMALAALDSALGLSQRQGLRQEQASNLEALGELYREAGEHTRALALYAEAAAINRELGLAVEAAADVRSEAEIQAALGAPERAYELAQAALRAHREVGARFEELGDLLLLAELAAQAGLQAESDTSLARAHALATRLGVRRARAEAALVAARLADRRREPAAVLHWLRSARRDLAEGGYGMEPEAFRLEARALATVGRLDSAATMGRRAIAALERIRGSYGSSLLRTSYVADKQVAYADLVKVLRWLGRTEEALEVADAGRGRAFLEGLAASRGRHVTRNPLERSLGNGDELLRRVDALMEQLRPAEEEVAGGDSAGLPKIEFLRGRLDSARGAYEAHAIRAAEVHSASSELAGMARVGADEVRARLRPGEALVEYQLTDDSLLVFVVRPDRLLALALPESPARLAARVRLAREQVVRHQADPAGSAALLEALHESLLGPARRAGLLAGIVRLVIVPQGVLSYVPFAALRDPRTGRYLVQDYTLLSLPSAATLVALRRGLPAPEAPDGAPAASIFAPQPEALPATRNEAERVREAVEHSAMYMGRRATEGAVRVALASGDVVHLATHATMNPRNPLFSRIELTRGGDGGPGSDGRLEVHEILGLRIASPLVFLSGCETGLGVGVTSGATAGEDYATLARAFLYAGARSAMATLWRVEDRGAAELATRFYRHLVAVPAVEALALAQRELLAHPRWGAPYYWAGYILSGDGELVPRAQNRIGLSVR